MKNRIEKFLNRYSLAAKNNVIVVGFSGGYDSLALLNIIYELSLQYKFKVIAAHLNHNWRKEESMTEAENCRIFCNKKNIEIYTEILDENEKHTETRARELRYVFFNRVIEKYSANALLTAHTKSDTAETLIYRIIKGTGIKGLQGISPKLGKIYRPMLDISREEIEQYCKKNGLIPNNDSSNQNNKYARNHIRNNIIPLLKKINYNYENAINNLSILAFEEEQIVKEYIQKLNVFENKKIKTQVFKNLSYNLQKRLIYELYAENNFEYTQEKIENTLSFVLDNLTSKSGKKYSLNKDCWLFVNFHIIEIISTTKKNMMEIHINSEGKYRFDEYELQIEKCNKNPKKFPLDKEYKAYIELNENINFTLRTRRCGDKFQPLGTKNSTKLKRYLINKNIPQHEKDKIILICKDNEILWISGFGISDKIKVVNNCTHVLTLKKIGGT